MFEGSLRYLLIVPVGGEVGDWVEQVRVQDPVFTWRANVQPHITLWAPAMSAVSESEAVRQLDELSLRAAATRQFFHDVQSFSYEKTNAIWLAPGEPRWFVDLADETRDYFKAITRPVKKDFDYSPHLTVFEEVADFELGRRLSDYRAQRFPHPIYLNEIVLLARHEGESRWRRVGEKRLSGV